MLMNQADWFIYMAQWVFEIEVVETIILQSNFHID